MMDEELQASNTEVVQETQHEDSPGDQEVDRAVQDQQNQKHQSEGNGTEQTERDAAPAQDQPEAPSVDQSPAEVSDEDLFPDNQTHPDGVSLPDQRRDQSGCEQKDQDLTSAAANRDAAAEPGGSVPALVITEAEEVSAETGLSSIFMSSSQQPSCAALLSPPVSPADPADPAEPQRPADLVSTDPSLSSSTDTGDMTCSDLLSLRSDSCSLSSEPAVSRRSEEDDTRSVTASSFMSLFHRGQLDPLEKDWLRSSALGNTAAQRRLLAQEPSLVFKKAALHWAAKQGRQEAVDLMIHRGADVNVRSGYTALHLASIHGHLHVVRALVHTYNAKTSIRDYHGKKAAHYWTGSTDVFHKPDSRSGGSFSHGQRTQRYVLPSVLLTRSRSQGQLNLEFGTVPQSGSHDVLDLQV